MFVLLLEFLYANKCNKCNKCTIIFINPFVLNINVYLILKHVCHVLSNDNLEI